MNISGLTLIVTGCLLLINIDATGVRRQEKQPQPCSTSEYHQFDFWIGHWDTFEVNNSTKVIAHNRVESMLNGCAIREVYEQADGLVGESFSIYDAARRVWHQSWVTNRGHLLTLEGGMSDGRMILTGNDVTDGKTRLLRGTWLRSGDGVRETADVSNDNGKSWTVLFDIIFKPAK